MASQDSFADLLSPPDVSEPSTPHMPHMTLPASNIQAVADTQAQRVDDATKGPTPSQRAKTPTPTPSASHISTPPPTISGTTTAQTFRLSPATVTDMKPAELAVASAEALRTKVEALQAALRDAKMSAAHHELQYKMLQQESAAALERMAVEARMAEDEHNFIYKTEQARVAATPVQQPSLPDGVIPVHKHLYQRLNIELQNLQDTNKQWEREYSQQEKLIGRQESEIASLGDKVTLLRERIRETKTRSKALANNYRLDSTPRSVYGTPHRSQGLEALLQASEMANPEMRQKKGHNRNTHSLSSLPTTPQRLSKVQGPLMYQTPSHRQPPLRVPATAPVPRTSAMRTPGIYGQPILPVIPHLPGPPSEEGTVSAPEDNDSEAETDILDPEDDGAEVGESQASRAATQMLKRSREEVETKRNSFKGMGMLEQSILPSGGGGGGGGGAGGASSAGAALKQTRLFGRVRKGGVERVVAGADAAPPAAKRQRTDELASGAEGMGAQGRVGLGISGVRQ
ncbi:hypothetical protein LTS14_002941 [Recurvomyces mirabilis]|uniref:uncharacterized protein n=1 Tax=Recurvomyces mirabilis TaxID=574656 RepID=UPI002DE03FC3|nr:hypothetical protein LTS14_002941 [Recurvomyces mirabilis]